MIRIVVRLLSALVLVVAAYLGGAVAGSAIAVNADWRQPDGGTRVYVIDNGVHTDLVLPASEFRDLIRADALGDPRYAARSHLTFGWGDRNFYLNTPSWWQMNPARAAAALVGAGATVLHVSHVPEPTAGTRIRPVMLRPEEYRRLVAYVRATFAEGAAVRGYGAADAFYPARGRYSAFGTCNEWTGRGLRQAGVRMGAWTPLPFGVMQWL